MNPDIAPIYPNSELPTIKRLAARGDLNATSWTMIRDRLNPPGLGWTPIFSGLLVHAGTFGALAGVAALGATQPIAGGFAAAAAAALVGVGYRGLENLVHGAAHYDVSRRHHRVNDAVGDLLFAVPVGQSVEGFRRPHLENHHGRFFSHADPCATRMRGHRDVANGQLPSLAGTLRRVPKEAVAFARTAGTELSGWVRALVWQGAIVLAPLIALVGLKTALLSYAAVMPLALGVVLPVVRALAEAGEHDYSPGPADAVIERTFDNIGFWNAFLHPFGDAYHVLHHLAPTVPQHHLGDLTRQMVRQDPGFARITRRRRGVLTAPEPYGPEEEPPSRQPAAPQIPDEEAGPANDNGTGMRSNQEMM